MNDKRKIHRDTIDYWEKVTSEKNASEKKHSAPKSDIYEKYLDELGIRKRQRLIDIGIGFGRFMKYYRHTGAKIFGFDINPDMIEAAGQRYPNQFFELKVGQAEETGYPEHYFDHLVCWGVFEELDQSRAFLEFSRILKTGGKVLLTGKNANYELDDTEALAAEESARAKNHTNNFTILNEVDFAGFGLDIAFEHYFCRRGDFAAGCFVDKRPEKFYEFLLILTKTTSAKYSLISLPQISSAYSSTFLALKGKDNKNEQ